MSAAQVLIIKTTSMGDVIHALPLVTDIMDARPGTRIDWVVEDSFALLPRLHPDVVHVIPVALRRWRRRWFAAETWRALAAARAELQAQSYAAIIDCQGLLKSALIARAARGQRWGFDAASAREPLAARLYDRRVGIGRDEHAIARNRALAAAALGYSIRGAPRFGLRIPAVEPALQTMTQQPYAVLLTNASRTSKLWPAESWRAVEHWLAAQGLATLLFWGSAEEQRQTQARAASMRAARLAPRCALDQLAAVLARAQLVIGLDTGLTHLAAAVGARTLGIFCDYDPARVGITGAAPCASLGGVNQAPASAAVIATAQRLLSDGAIACA